MAKWGLVPYWAKPEAAAKPPYSTINARAETVQTAASFREPFRQRRCLVTASGWYEWQKLDVKKKRPIHMRPADARASSSLASMAKPKGASRVSS
jgi:putative SOS response-associated peptidase YedK